MKSAVEVLTKGGVIAFPTDTLYGLGCAFGQRRATDRIRLMRNLDLKRRPLTFLLPDLGQVAHYAVVTTEAYRILSRILPGPYCIELGATPAVPDPFVVGQRRNIGVRVPAHPVCERLLWSLGAPLLTATAKGRDDRLLRTAAEIDEEFGSEVDLILDGGPLLGPPSTVISLLDDWVRVLRQGKGPTENLVG
ncbi:MAG TPA: L-threonylcarbamoyladenylate synthase [Polyangia bacterium]|nr:L-threonylcarbamoyladenylate synthase [Polyangia bacterium]